MAKDTKVTRITASDSASAPKTVKAAKTEKPVKTVKKSDKPAKRESVKEGKANVFVRIGRYFKGAWFELRQVRWPTRKATWGLTIAVILFSAFFTALILLLDALFKFLFQLIIT